MEGGESSPAGGLPRRYQVLEIKHNGGGGTLQDGWTPQQSGDSLENQCEQIQKNKDELVDDFDDEQEFKVRSALAQQHHRGCRIPLGGLFSRLFSKP